MDTDRQEDSDATRRFHRKVYDENGSDTMYSVPATPAENEPISPDLERKNQDLSFGGIIWFIRLAAIVYISGIMFRIWDDDEIRLHLLHSVKTLLQHSARILGTWALKVEERYNKTVDSLH